MNKPLTTKIFLIGLGLVIVGLILIVVGAATTSHDAYTGAVSIGPLLVVGYIVMLIGGLVETVAWIGALVALAKISAWGWFVFVLLLSGIGMLAYIIAGPNPNRNLQTA